MLAVRSLRQLNSRRRQPNYLLGTHPPLGINPSHMGLANPRPSVLLPLLFDNLHCRILYIASTARIIQYFIFILLLSLFLVFFVSCRFVLLLSRLYIFLYMLYNYMFIYNYNFLIIGIPITSNSINF